MFRSKAILGEEVWNSHHDGLIPASEREIALHYARARSLCRHSGLSLYDIKNLTQKFWDFHFDLVAARDMTAFIIATIHVNLCIGTLGSFSEQRPDLRNLLDRLLNFDVCGEFMLTEVGHGLDARNLETTATLQADGSFDLHTPHLAASKAMPPTTPCCGIPRVAVVFARLVVGEKSHGVKPFIVLLSDARTMRPGITSRILPTRPGTKPLDHSITTFDHVRLPPKALLGSLCKPKSERTEFLRHIRRVSVGTLSLSIMGISAIRIGTRIAAVYSERRTITAADGRSTTPIMSFSTQQRPIVEGWVQGKVLTAFARWTVDMCPDPSDATQHALATIFKSTVIKAARLLGDLSERCGWQGLFAYNQISELALTFQGNSIAEGDTLVLCIRLVSELLGGKFELPRPRNELTPLARCEQKLMEDLRAELAKIGGYGEHRGPAFDRHILPRCRPLVEAIGHRMAYEAAEHAGVALDVLELYGCMCAGRDLSCLPREKLWNGPSQHPTPSEPYDTVLAQIRAESACGSELDDYVTAPIVSDEAWINFVKSLRTFNHPAVAESNWSKL
ncbi:Acyl-coenzyme A oxidase 2 peroxisomal [Fusarium albosuccineum]|uniref:Acyl-coenzyme A oxidase 2 peroxisomal n=1 Tax=Fusarium albosuccineum TaxID=1237068 RepID=A0A8H4P864_9HYPO|nr:Acyl-coenzyme A oxidase 2 peroxisomal [Fusarium albosuccineum]